MREETYIGGRKKWVDLGKGISMFFVVLFHCEIYLSENGEPQYSLLVSFFRMPFFFFLSGYVYVSDWNAFSLKRKIKQIARGILWTYLVFTLLVTVLKVFSGYFSIQEGMRNILLGWAAWFVVTLGSAQLIFALVFRFTKKVRNVILFMVLSLAAGYAVNCAYSGLYPYYFDKTLIVIFYLGLGILYRKYEDRLAGLLKYKYLTLGAAVYFGLVMLEFSCIRTTANLFYIEEYHNFLLFLAYSVSGIFFMLAFVRLIPPVRFLCFMGANSLVFYYFNGGVIKAIRYMAGGLAVDSSSYLFIFLAAIAASLLISVMVLIMKRYFPFMLGNKEAFNRISEKFRLPVKW